MQELVLRLAADKAGEIPPKDLPRAAQALATSKATVIEKARLLRDKPTEIKETRSLEELVLTLRRLDVLRMEIDGSKLEQTD